MSRWPHVIDVQVYYEDTDHSGVVYHANYLKYFERSREHLLGVTRLVQLLEEEGLGFVVYKIDDLRFHDGAVFGETLQIKTTPQVKSEYRISFVQEVWRPGGTRPAVRGIVEMACLDQQRKLAPLPADVRALSED